MKKIIIAIMLLASVATSAQTDVALDSLIREVQTLRKELHEADSINKLILDGIYGNIDKPRYKMYQTENIYNLLKLDTRTGAIWQVQYRMKNVKASTVPIEYGFSAGVTLESLGWDGRFELYPTNNMYTFILVDTEKGYPYQVQWSTNPKQRFRVRIY